MSQCTQHLQIKCSFSRQTFEIVVKNGFINAYSEEDPTFRSTLSRCHSAPDLTVAASLFASSARNNSSKPVSNVEAIKGKLQQLHDQNSQPLPPSHRMEGSYLSSQNQIFKRWQHLQGECKPCSYFAFKKDGCRKGDACEFCHLDTRDEIRAKIHKSRDQRQMSFQNNEHRFDSGSW